MSVVFMSFEGECQFYRQEQSDALYQAAVIPKNEKFMVTFPYPYTNGLLHLGHGYTVLRADFVARHKRQMGVNVMFPFGLHGSGMPIGAAAQKLSSELVSDINQSIESLNNDSSQHVKTKFKGSKTKLAVKSGSNTQAQTLLDQGIPSEDLEKFCNPDYWLEYFPPRTLDTVKRLGCSIDDRRTFMTTDLNHNYSQFVLWQYDQLIKKKALFYGSRLSIYNSEDKAPCVGHERSQGEDSGTIEYKLLEYKLSEHQRIVVCTMRPETVEGATSVFADPELDYLECIPLKVKTVQVREDLEAYWFDGDNACGVSWFMSEHCAENAFYQGLIYGDRQTGRAFTLKTVKGASLIGQTVENTPKLQLQLSRGHDALPILASHVISPIKGSGFVLCVPSDSPEDYMNWLASETKLPLVEFIDIPQATAYSATKCIAKDICVKLKVKSVKDTAKLNEAKKICYKAGFYHGSINGVHAAEVREQYGQQLQLATFSECEEPVVSRTGVVCVVAKVKQLYLSYDKPEWKQLALDCCNSMSFDNPNTKHAVELGITNMKEWAVTRQRGLGTHADFEVDGKSFAADVIESLSDSTIYMAYYTICHKLPPSYTTNQLKRFPADRKLYKNDYDCIFNDAPTEDPYLLELRASFQYWYPMDLRVTGRDLCANHLTMSIYHHSIIFDKKYWPLGFSSNGHIMVDGEKMSKSLGNFITLNEAMDQYGVDVVRMTLAEAGDTWERVNFYKDSAATCQSKLDAIVNDDYQPSEKTGDQIDLIIATKGLQSLELSDSYYEKLQFRDITVLGLYEMNIQIARARKLKASPWAISFLRLIQATILEPLAPYTVSLMKEKLQIKCLRSATEQVTLVPSLLESYLILEKFLEKHSIEKHCCVVVAQNYSEEQFAVLRVVAEGARSNQLDKAFLINKIKAAGIKDIGKALGFAEYFVNTTLTYQGIDVLQAILDGTKMTPVDEKALFTHVNAKLPHITVKQYGDNAELDAYVTSIKKAVFAPSQPAVRAL